MNYLTNYYKNLSEQLQRKVNQLTFMLNEVEAPFNVYEPLSSGGLSDDPNTRYFAGIEPVDDSERPESDDFDPDLKAWTAPFTNSWPSGTYPFNNWASWLNAFYQNWNNLAWWNSGVQDFILSIFGDGYDYQMQGDNIIMTEQMKQIVWNCVQGMMIAGGQTSNTTEARTAALNVLRQYQTQYGIDTHNPAYFTEYHPYQTNYYVPGISQSQFPPPPWTTAPGYVPFPSAPVAPSP